jgi:hypothetical protein
MTTLTLKQIVAAITEAEPHQAHSWPDIIGIKIDTNTYAGIDSYLWSHSRREFIVSWGESVSCPRWSNATYKPVADPLDKLIR